MEQLSQIIANGLIIGAVYALVAVGFSMVYGVMRLINFAHGGIFTIGAFLALLLTRDLGLSLVYAAPIVAIVGGVIGVAIERLLYRPLRDFPPLATLVTSLALLLIIENGLAVIFGSDPIHLPDELTTSTVFQGPFNMRITASQLLVIVAAIALLIVVDSIVVRTGIGRAMRARSEDHVLAAVSGINPDRVTMFAFLISGALGTLGGLLVAVDFGCDPYMGTTVGLKAFAGCVIGSIRNLRGALLGGFLVGLCENIVAGYLSTEYQNAIVLVFLAFALLLMPNGILGIRDRRRI